MSVKDASDDLPAFLFDTGDFLLRDLLLSTCKVRGPLKKFEKSIEYKFSI